MDLRCRRLLGVDRSPPRRCAQGGRREERRHLHRARGRGHAPFRRAGRAPDLARRADRQGHGPEHPRRLRPERPPDPPHERRAAAPRRPRMAGIMLAEMAHARPAAGSGPRRGEDDRHLLPRSAPARWRRGSGWTRRRSSSSRRCRSSRSSPTPPPAPGRPRVCWRRGGTPGPASGRSAPSISRSTSARPG